ncbi:MAG: cold-shock protein, partial [Planctomycetota bacterium]
MSFGDLPARGVVGLSRRPCGKEVPRMPTGKVKWFDPKKGYGFIIGDEEQDVF